MKCAACGYEHVRKEEMVDKVIRYKSGKRKGEIKEVITDIAVLEIGHSSFIKLSQQHDIGVLQFENNFNTMQDAEIYACPECGTLKLDL